MVEGSPRGWEQKTSSSVLSLRQRSMMVSCRSRPLILAAPSPLPAVAKSFPPSLSVHASQGSQVEGMGVLLQIQSVSTTHRGEHPSPAVLLPSSQISSVPASSAPLPQLVNAHVLGEPAQVHPGFAVQEAVQPFTLRASQWVNAQSTSV